MQQGLQHCANFDSPFVTTPSRTTLIWVYHILFNGRKRWLAFQKLSLDLCFPSLIVFYHQNACFESIYIYIYLSIYIIWTTPVSMKGTATSFARWCNPRALIYGEGGSVPPNGLCGQVLKSTICPNSSRFCKIYSLGGWGFNFICLRKLNFTKQNQNKNFRNNTCGVQKTVMRGIAKNIQSNFKKKLMM